MKLKEFILFLGTDDLKKTAEYYLNILNLTLYKDQGICQIYNISKDCKIGFCSHMSITREAKSPIITFVTEDVDEVYEDLLNKGSKISQPPQKNPKFKIYHFFTEDPNGYTIEVQKFLD
ncbi:MAG: VOC family protein [Candidatus Lokiarchaeota archaeon]|nr:VOC family protein [Candidatus Lokiarchaeota archaeon]